MHPIDWILVVFSLALVLAFALYTRRFVKSVADFLAAGRCAGRYLLANARGEADSGLANTMAKFEQILVAGFVLNFWEKIQVPILLIVAISGFVVYRFRETRALTLAQFLEMRYSRRYRTFMGGLAFVSGILNYGVFPAVSARFFIYFLNLPQSVHLAGFELSTFALIMLAYLSFTVFMVTIGGQVTLMVTDCIEGLLSHLIYIATVVAVFFVVSWRQIVDVMSSGGPGHSGINPFDASGVEDFNFWFVVMYTMNLVYQTMALQNRQGFNAAARTPHESRMGFVLGNWRTYARLLMILVLGACAITFLKHPDFAGSAGSINAEINSISDPYIQKQMTVPVALSHLLPIGIKGLFCAMMIMGLFAGDSGHMHSWGSIFVQDVVLPLRKRPLSPKQHIWALRAAVVGVAAFAFFFSLWFKQTQYLALWWVLTAMLFVGGAGVAIIGGLYWTRGTTHAAWAGQITGSVVAMIGVLLTNASIWARLSLEIGPTLRRAYRVQLPVKFWFNGMQIAFIAACLSILVYVVVSILTCRRPFDLDRLLHRGAYALPGEGRKPPTSLRERLRLHNLLQFDSNFTLADKLASGGIFAWALLLLGINLVVSVWNLAFHQWPITWWSRYWLVCGVGLPFLIAVGTLVWFGVGCTRDLFAFFAALRTMTRDVTDDGRVTEHQDMAGEPERRDLPSRPKPASASTASDAGSGTSDGLSDSTAATSPAT
jgi:SSS family solute:Na+ symporter